MAVIDSHAHLVELKKKNLALFEDFVSRHDPAADLVMDVGIHLDDLEERRAIHREHGIGWWSLGIYPSAAAESGWVAELARLESMLAKRAASGDLPQALGEMGVDHYRNYGPAQGDLLRGQLDLAARHGLPVIIHCREAALDCHEALKDYQGRVRAVMHCFSLDRAWATRFLDLGCYVSFAGNVTYRNAHDLQDAARVVPEDLLLVESDCPYLAPLPWRGSTNSPAYTSATVDFLATLRGTDQSVLGPRLARNFKALFGVEGKLQDDAGALAQG